MDHKDEDGPPVNYAVNLWAVDYFLNQRLKALLEDKYRRNALHLLMIQNPVQPCFFEYEFETLEEALGNKWDLPPPLKPLAELKLEEPDRNPRRVSQKRMAMGRHRLIPQNTVIVSAKIKQPKLAFWCSFITVNP